MMKIRMVLMFVLLSCLVVMTGCLFSSGPQAEFTATPWADYPPLEVQFDASGSYSPNGPIVSYSWDFDADGETDATGITTRHTFYEKGKYPVALIVTDSAGESGKRVRKVEAKNREPIAGFDYELRQITMEVEVWFYATGSYDPDGKITAYLWDYGDGDSGIGEDVEHIYPRTEKVYQVKLTVIDDDGAKGSVVRSIHIGCCGS